MYRGRFPRPPGPDERERYYERERAYEQHERPYERMPPHFEEGIPEDAPYHKV